jgi:hypothetical protein
MPEMNGVGEPCAGEPHARFDRGLLGRLNSVAGAADPGPVRWKTPPPWPGRDLNRIGDLPNQRPTSLRGLQIKSFVGASRLRTRWRRVLALIIPIVPFNLRTLTGAEVAGRSLGRGFQASDGRVPIILL